MRNSLDSKEIESWLFGDGEPNQLNKLLSLGDKSLCVKENITKPIHEKTDDDKIKNFVIFIGDRIKILESYNEEVIFLKKLRIKFNNSIGVKENG